MKGPLDGIKIFDLTRVSRPQLRADFRRSWCRCNKGGAARLGDDTQVRPAAVKDRNGNETSGRQVSRSQPQQTVLTLILRAKKDRLLHGV